MRAGVTVTVTLFDVVQPKLFVAVTKYIVVADGDAVTELPVVALNPSDGDQEKVEEGDEALKTTLLPAQITGAAGVITIAAGNGFTVTVAEPEKSEGLDVHEASDIVAIV